MALFYNESFESGVGGWVRQATNTVVDTGTTLAKDGVSSLRFRTTSSPGERGVRRVFTGLVPGKEHTFGVWMASSNTTYNHSFTLSVIEGGVPIAGSPDFDPTNQNVFYYRDVTFTPTTPTVTIQISAYVTGTNRFIYVDEASLYGPDPVSVPVERSISDSYNVKTAVQRSIATDFGVKSSIAKSFADSYNVKSSISRNFADNFAVRVSASKSLYANWTVKAQISTERADEYYVRRQLVRGAYWEDRYAVRKTISTSVTTNWGETKSISVAISDGWSVESGTAFEKAISTSWNVRKTVQTTISDTYTVRKALSQVRMDVYGVRRPITPTQRQERYSVRRALAVQASTAWNVRRAVFLDSPLTTWDIHKAVGVLTIPTTWSVRRTVAEKAVSTVFQVRALATQAVYDRWKVGGMLLVVRERINQGGNTGSLPVPGYTTTAIMGSKDSSLDSGGTNTSTAQGGTGETIFGLPYELEGAD